MGPSVIGLGCCLGMGDFLSPPGDSQMLQSLRDTSVADTSGTAESLVKPGCVSVLVGTYVFLCYVGEGDWQRMN